MTNREKIGRKARDLGFEEIGIARAEYLTEEGARLQEWLERGYQGGMAWMERTAGRRRNPQEVLPGARSVIALAMNYYTPESRSDGSDTGKISRYAWGEDYHDLIGERLESLLRWIAEEFPESESRAFVDSGPAMDKAWAVRAGIGWLGKHANVITRDHGSWVFLAEILTTLDLPPDAPATDLCGTCTRCMVACPTGAIIEPYVVDSRRCLSYLTIEHRGEFPPDSPREFDGWIFGCDVCQDVCPWNVKFAEETGERFFLPREGHVDPVLDDWQRMTPEEFAARFRGSPIRRSRHEGLMRNIAAVRRTDSNGPAGASHQ